MVIKKAYRGFEVAIRVNRDGSVEKLIVGGGVVNDHSDVVDNIEAQGIARSNARNFSKLAWSWLQKHEAMVKVTV